MDNSFLAGLEIARRLIRHCDIVTENFGVSAMERMGLGYENLRAIRKDIILLSISGNGQTGPTDTLSATALTFGAQTIGTTSAGVSSVFLIPCSIQCPSR